LCLQYQGLLKNEQRDKWMDGNHFFTSWTLKIKAESVRLLKYENCNSRANQQYK
jgi:hypothetical protein